MDRLKNKVAIVTGAASGMGKAIAELFGAEGAQVVVADLNLEGAEEVAATIKKNGGEAFAQKINVADEEDINTLVAETLKRYQTIDILINNAGVMDNMAAANDVDNKTWEKVFAVNTDGVMYLTRAVLPTMLEKDRGSIVNVASVGGLHGGTAGAAYVASKHAVVGYTKNTAYMYAKTGVRTNAIAPGGIMTNIASSMHNVNQFGAERQALGQATNPRWGKPEEIAYVALFLASDEASLVNGAIIPVDGGWSVY